MADRYIDPFEVQEYGSYFLTEVLPLVGLSRLVDVDALRQLVEDDMRRVATELAKSGLQRGDLRQGRASLATAVPTLRQEIQRFWNFLHGLDASVRFDLQAFFPGGRLGSINELKPADLGAKADEIVRGFDLPANAQLPERESRLAKLVLARAALGEGLSARSGAANRSISATSALGQAREKFLRTYNGVAKRLVLGLLTQLGREEEYVRFFLDLQVHEDSPARTTPLPPPASGTGDPPPAQ